VLSKFALAPVADRCSPAQIPALLQELCSHSIRLFGGLNPSILRELLDAASDPLGPDASRPILLLGLPQSHRTEIIIASAINRIAAVAGGLWPIWFGGENFSELNDSTLSHQYLPIKLATLAERFPSLSTGWAEAAVGQALHGLSPRVPGAAAELEWFQLCHAINPNGLIAVVTLEESSPQSALPAVHAFEWLAANGNVAIAVLCRELPPPEPPFDRLTYGARSVRPEIFSPTQVEKAAPEAADVEAFDLPSVPSVSVLLPPVHGRPHPQSAIEQRLSKMIEADAELRSKFVFNARVGDVSLKSPKVDLLWAEGRLVIELDGDEHRGRRAYRDDRHRDYELLCGGYAVVRIPNDEIVEDFTRTLEKIRSAVRLRSLSNGGMK
jgi:very-short-patch-repair endonuclease